MDKTYNNWVIHRKRGAKCYAFQKNIKTNLFIAQVLCSFAKNPSFHYFAIDKSCFLWLNSSI